MIEKLKDRCASISGKAVQVLHDRDNIRDIIARNIRRAVSEILEWNGSDFSEDAVLKQERFEPKEWARPIEDQISTIQSLLPGLAIDEQYKEARLTEPLKEGTQRIALPKLEALGRILEVDNPYEQIGVLIEHVCSLLEKQREGRFTHYRRGELGPERVQVVSDIVRKRKEMEDGVPGDIIILDVDTGNRYAGWTPRRARSHSVHESEIIGLSSVDIAWMLIVNPRRLQNNTELSMDSVMERYLSLDRGWVTVLFFYHRGGKLEFGYRWERRAYFDCGAVVAEI